VLLFDTRDQFSVPNYESMTNLIFPLLSNLLNLVHTAQDLNHIHLELSVDITTEYIIISYKLKLDGGI